MPKISSQSRIISQFGDYASEMPAAWPGSAQLKDSVHRLADLMSALRGQLSGTQYADLLSLGGFAVRQYKVEKAAETLYGDGGSRPYVWIYDSASEGWDVQVLGVDSDTADRWFAVRGDARFYAEGLSAATGWVIKDDSTARNEAAEFAAEQAATIADDLLRRLRGKGGDA